MKIVPLGIGDAFSNKYHNTSLLVDDELLIDCGADVPRQYAKYTASEPEISIPKMIAITHIHGDHIYGLERIGFMGYFLLGIRPKLIVPELILGELEQVLQPTMSDLQGLNGGPVKAKGLETFFDLEVVDIGHVRQIKTHNRLYSFVFKEVNHVMGKRCFSFTLEALEGSPKTLTFSGDCKDVCSYGTWTKGPGEFIWVHDVTSLDLGEASVHCPVTKLADYLKNVSARDKTILVPIHFHEGTRDKIQKILSEEVEKEEVSVQLVMPEELRPICGV